jgi:hypothetical protein
VIRTPEEDLDPLLAAVVTTDSAAEQDTLRCILEADLDQGWFLRPLAEELLNPSPAEMTRFYDALSERGGVSPDCDDPWAAGAPSARPIPGTDPGWVVLTQRCDLVRAFVTEPLVELARASRLQGSDAAAAKTNSPRSIFLADAGDGHVGAVDLRQRAWMPKTRLLTQADLTPAIAGERGQKRFRLRLGQRYWRDPVPDDLVEALQRPLRDAVRGSAARIATLRNFSMLLGRRSDGDRVIVFAVAEDGRVDEADRDWNELLDVLRNRAPAAHARIDEDSGVYSSDDVPLGLWLDSFKFDFDELSYSRKAGADQVAPDR